MKYIKFEELKIEEKAKIILTHGATGKLIFEADLDLASSRLEFVYKPEKNKKYEISIDSKGVNLC